MFYFFLQLKVLVVMVRCITDIGVVMGLYSGLYTSSVYLDGLPPWTESLRTRHTTHRASHPPQRRSTSTQNKERRFSWWWQQAMCARRSCRGRQMADAIKTVVSHSRCPPAKQMYDNAPMIGLCSLDAPLVLIPSATSSKLRTCRVCRRDAQKSR